MMREDVGTTKRKPLTPTQRLALFEAFKGKCVLCGDKIYGRDWIDEHLLALGLGGTNKWDNRGPAHIACAEAKTRNEDMPRINKAKAQKKADLGIRKGPYRPIQSAGFAKREKRPKPLTKVMARRPVYTDYIESQYVEEGHDVV